VDGRQAPGLRPRPAALTPCPERGAPGAQTAGTRLTASNTAPARRGTAVGPPPRLRAKDPRSQPPESESQNLGSFHP
jgi:hypothetical protein